MNVAERIDAALNCRRLSRRKAAIMAGLPPTTFQSAMERHGNMTVSTIEKIASALNVSPAWLCGWSEEGGVGV